MKLDHVFKIDSDVYVSFFYFVLNNYYWDADFPDEVYEENIQYNKQFNKWKDYD